MFYKTLGLDIILGIHSMIRKGQGVVLASYEEVMEYVELVLSSTTDSRFERIWSDELSYEVATYLIGQEPNIHQMYGLGHGNVAGLCQAGDVLEKFSLEQIELVKNNITERHAQVLRDMVGSIHYSVPPMVTELLYLTAAWGIELTTGHVDAYVLYVTAHERAHMIQSMGEFSPMSEIMAVQSGGLASKAADDVDFLVAYLNQAQEANANIDAYCLLRKETKSVDRKWRITRPAENIYSLR